MNSRAVFDVNGGTSFGNTEAHLAFAAGVDWTLNPHLQVGGEFGRFDNIITKSLHDDVRDTAANLSPTDGAPVNFETSVPAGYGLGTVRVSHAVSPMVDAFADGGLGVAHVHSTLTASSGGSDVTGQVLETVAMPPAQTALYTAVGGGFSVHLGQRTAVDAGYRYGRIGTTTAMNTNTLYGGLRFKW
jgi:opacity protein-like surface antigen